MSGLRIVGGRWKRSPIDVPRVPGLRPTPDRVRETLFNWLGAAVESARCLDLFAGTGALGLEAASRGAASVVFVEPDRNARAALSATVARLVSRVAAPGDAPPRLEVRAGDAIDALAAASRRGERFDLVLLDPPFGLGWIERILPGLPAVLAAGARIYVERESAIDEDFLAAVAPQARFALLRAGRAGAVRYHLLASRAGEAR